MIVTAKPDANVFRSRHLKTQILVASNFGNVDRDLRMASCCRKERDKDYYIDCTHDRTVHDRSPSISPHDRIPMAACPQDPGKSRGLRVLDRLVARPKYSNNWTTATLYASSGLCSNLINRSSHGFQLSRNTSAGVMAFAAPQPGLAPSAAKRGLDEAPFASPLGRERKGRQ